MTIESAADRLAYLSDFGAEVTYTPAGGSGRAITALVDKSAADLNFDQSAGAVASSVALFVRTADVPEIAQGDTFADVPLDGATFSFRAVQPIRGDGQGMTSIALERVA